MEIKKDNTAGLVILSFCNNNLPVVREISGRDYITYGERNDYPKFLIFLSRRSAKHGRILIGKRDLIIGKGVAKRTPMANSLVAYTDENGTVIEAKPVNSEGETMDDIIKKSALDVEIFGGFRWFIIWDNAGTSFEIYHVGFEKIRTGKKQNYFYKKDWNCSKDEIIEYTAFNTNNKKGTQIFAYNEYQPGMEVYPVPNYMPCIEYIQADVEVAGHTLGNAQGGFTPSKSIALYNGEPDNDGKKAIEKYFTAKFTGKYGKKFVLSFNNANAKGPEIQDLGSSDLTKEDFTAIDNLIQQNIFTGHGVPSPMLFGIKTAGQLGGNTELQLAYALFINMYAKPKQIELEKIVNKFGKLLGLGNDYYLQDLNPIGVQLDPKDVVNSLPLEYVYEKLGIPKELMDGPKVGADNQIIGQAPAAGDVVDSQQASQVNSILTNLTPQQHGQVLRVIRDYSKKRSGMNLETAKALLSAGYGFSDDQVNKLLGIADNAQQFKRTVTNDELLEKFEAFGELADDYEIVKARRVCFGLGDAANKEKEWLLNFKDVTLTKTDKSILDLIKGDKLITPEVIAKVIKQKPAFVINRIKTLEDRGLLETNSVKVGEDNQVERSVTPQDSPIKTVGGDGGNDISVTIKYRYDWKKSVPTDQRNTSAHPSRAFCIKMMQLKRLYTRKEIEEISQWLGYSVFDRKGGFWNDHGTIEPECRHDWYSVIVVKKKGNE